MAKISLTIIGQCKKKIWLRAGLKRAFIAKVTPPNHYTIAPNLFEFVPCERTYLMIFRRPRNFLGFGCLQFRRNCPNLDCRNCVSTYHKENQSKTWLRNTHLIRILIFLNFVHFLSIYSPHSIVRHPLPLSKFA